MRGAAFVTSCAFHVALLLLTLVALRREPHTPTPAFVPPDRPSHRLIWLSRPGPGGGGGGGGNRMKAPPRQARLPGEDKITVPVAKAPNPIASEPARTEPVPIEQLNIPARRFAGGIESAPGVIEARPELPTLSQGPGTDGGAGRGARGGIGADEGLGLGAGKSRGTGGDAYRRGGGVTAPIEIRRGTPRYTADAVRARIQGAVLLECTVETDGTCTHIRVLRSLDPMFGLDQEAIEAARAWRFRPGTRMGEPVPVLVTIEVTFTLR